MPTPKLPEEKKQEIARLSAQGIPQDEVAAQVGVATGTVAKYRTYKLVPPSQQPTKKMGECDWREWSQWAIKGQELKRKASWSQPSGEAEFELGGGSPIILATFGDQHIGSWGTDYELFCSITREIKETPNLYMVMMGDETEHAIKLRSVLEVLSQIFPPDIQEHFIEAWAEEIKDKIAWAGWSNHGIERQEKQAGSSVLKNIFARRATYFNGIAHVTLKVGSQTYKVASNHKFRGNSMYSRVHGPKRYLRMEAPDREIVLQGDLHTPELDMYWEGGMLRIAITSGTTHLNSGYAQRYFSLKTCPAYPCIVLYPDEHKIVPFWTIGEAVEHLK